MTGFVRLMFNPGLPLCCGKLEDFFTVPKMAPVECQEFENSFRNLVVTKVRKIFVPPKITGYLGRIHHISTRIFFRGVYEILHPP